VVTNSSETPSLEQTIRHNYNDTEIHAHFQYITNIISQQIVNETPPFPLITSKITATVTQI